MIEVKDSVKLSFSCNENLTQMSVSMEGRFCEKCKHHVVDFTNASYSEIKAARDSSEKTCGIFTAEQLYPSLRPIQISQRARSYAFLSALFLSVGLTSVSAQSGLDPKVEQSSGASNAPSLTPSEVNEQMKRGEHISLSIGEPRDEEIVVTVAKPKKVKMRRKRWYTSKRFPFVHHRQRRYAGKFINHF